MICSNNSFREHFYGELPRISIERFRRIMRLVSRPKLPVTPATRTKPRPRTALYSDRPKQGSKIYDHEQENMSSRVRGNNNNSLSEGFAALKKNIKASFVPPLVSLKRTKRGRGRLSIWKSQLKILSSRARRADMFRQAALSIFADLISKTFNIPDMVLLQAPVV